VLDSVGTAAATAAGFAATWGVVRVDSGAGQPVNMANPRVTTIALCMGQTVLSATEMPAFPTTIIDMT
jgi:hypothetical protein